MMTEKQIEKMVAEHGACIRSVGKHHVDVEITTVTGSRASVAISLTERRFCGCGFNPQGWTSAKFLTTTVAMMTLIALAQAIWDACEVQA